MDKTNDITTSVKFAQRFIAGVSTRVSNAEALYKWLGVKTPFHKWIERKIAEYDFEYNVDYVVETQAQKGKGRPKKIYWLSLSMSKEVSMVERNAKGREARRYFLECEKAAKEALQLSVQGKLLKPVTRTISSAKLVLYWSDGVIDHEDFSEEAVNYICRHIMPKSVLLDHDRVKEALKPIQEGMTEGLSLWAEMGEMVEGREEVLS